MQRSLVDVRGMAGWLVKQHDKIALDLHIAGLFVTHCVDIRQLFPLIVLHIAGALWFTRLLDHGSIETLVILHELREYWFATWTLIRDVYLFIFKDFLEILLFFKARSCTHSFWEHSGSDLVLTYTLWVLWLVQWCLSLHFEIEGFTNLIRIPSFRGL